MFIDLKQINPKKILIINTFGIGDVLFTFPFIDNLKANLPNASIGYVGNRRTAAILGGNPHLDRVHVYERDEFNDLYKTSKWQFWHRVWEQLKSVKREEYEVVFDFSLNGSLNFLTKVIGIKHRIGFNYKNRNPYLTVKIPFQGFEGRHVVDHYLDILKHLNLKTYSKELAMEVAPEDRAWAQEFLQKAGCTFKKRLIGIIPGAGESWGNQARFRRWPLENYAKLVDKLIEKPDVELILMGAKQEKELCERLSQAAAGRLIEAYGKTTIGQLAALLEKCHAVILNDGGPLHVAVAVRTRTISIFGPVDEKVYGPYGGADRHIVVKKNLPCQPCYRRFRMSNCEHVSCLTTLTADELFQNIERIL